MEDAAARRKRKEEARKLKRQRIEGHGGVRPRSSKTGDDGAAGHQSSSTSPPYPVSERKQKKINNGSRQQGPKHRFGHVMEQVPCRNIPRKWTLSIAIPGSVVSNCQTRELRTHLVGQIARAATIYEVDEIVVYDDKLANETRDRGYYRGNKRNRDHSSGQSREANENNEEHQHQPHENEDRIKFDPHTFMARVLQYCECPQYLRRHFFPMHPDLQFSGLLAPIDAPHHVRVEERSSYREGVVLEKKGNTGSLVNCGIRSRPVEIDRVLTPGVRCTVQLDPKAYGSTSRIQGTAVSPAAPRETSGIYWGYTTRLAESLSAVFDDCPFDEGYDLKIGTSERGDVTVDDKAFALPKFQHSLIVFGGVAGIEECVDADEKLRIPGSQSRKLFDMWVNTCPFQGSRTIRTEEAVIISLARLSPLVSAGNDGATNTTLWENLHADQKKQETTDRVEFSDEPPSDESSSDDE